jgi:hypothetical protein
MMKRQTQDANSKYWRMQMQWRKQKKNVEAQEAFNPHINWTIEGHARALIEDAKARQDKIKLKETLEEQQRQNLHDFEKEKESEL